MFKHKNKGRGTITVTDDSSNHYTFVPGKIITLNRIYKEFEAYEIVCTNPDWKKPVENKVPTTKIKETKSLGGD